MDAKQELVKSWLIKAQHDLASARRLSEGSEVYLDTAISHCQQAAEKAVKGWLTYQDQRFEKIHDVRVLITLAATIEPAFEKHYDAAEYLTPYSMVYRYPGNVLEPEEMEFREALRFSEDIYKFVISLLPAFIYSE